MANILDYLAWRGDLSLLQSPYNDVDSLILSRVSYLPFDGIVPDTFGGASITLAGAYGRYQELRGSGIPDACTPVLLEDDLALFRALAQCRRFGGLLLSGFINTIDPDAGEQFAAVTISAGNSGPLYVSFRGTDTTLVGWKEDFSMAFLPSIPSQISAVGYLDQTASAVPGDIYTGGHSKGGNLAVYAASFCKPEIQSRIRLVTNNDGPGFYPSVLSSDGYQAVKDRIKTFLPQSSVIGMLLDHEEDYTVVHSTQSGLLQHDLYSWEVLGTGFIQLDTVTNSSQFIDKTLKYWVSEMDQAQREQLADILFDLLDATNARTTKELTTDWVRTAGTFLQSFKSVDEASRQMLFKMLGQLFRAAKRSLPVMLPKQSSYI